MFFLRFTIFMMVVGFIAVVFTQAVIPLMRKRPLFPLFRRGAKLEGEVIELQEQVREEELADKVEALQEKLEEKRTPSKPL